MRIAWLVSVVAVVLGSGCGAGTSRLATDDAPRTMPPSDGAAPDASAHGGMDAAAVDAGESAVSTGPITTPIDTWSWLPIAGARCANGTPTGIGVNRSAVSSDLLITLQGGGACWDATTCLVTKSAVHLDQRYDATLFASDFVASTTQGARDLQNPLSRATTVFVPYCTGDLHAGDAVRNYALGAVQGTVHHVGARNIDAMLSRLKEGLPAPGTVWVIGSSAGGFGATLNVRQISEAFPMAQVHMLADCAPLLTPVDGRWEVWKNAWNMRLPSGCSECGQRFGAVVDAVAQDNAAHRIALLAYAQDAVLGAYFGFDAATEQQALDSLFATSYQHANTHYFLVPGTDHVMLQKAATLLAPDGTALSAWLTGWVLGLPTWKNAR